MLSLPDAAILGVLALLVFGERRLPGVMRQAGRIVRDIQNTSQAFVREMERAADFEEPKTTPAAPGTPADEEERPTEAPL